MKLELYINNQLADLKEDSLVAITKTYENLTNPLNYYADWSKSIKLPLSDRNNAIFSHFNRLDSLVTNLTIDPLKKQDFYILNNKELMMNGYLQLNNVNTIYTDECYEITLYSTFGWIMNVLKMLTFNPNATGIDQQYIIQNPFSNDLKIDRNLVKRSFDQQIRHNLVSDDVIDWIGFAATYQGKYDSFSSDRVQLLPNGRTDDLPQERDEHYEREFRSYYQQPYIWVDKLWKCAKDKIQQITGYSLNLDRSWFTESNPYYSDLIYTCPSLFNSDDNYIEYNETFSACNNYFTLWKYDQNTLSTPSVQVMNNLTKMSGSNMYEDVNGVGIFNRHKNYGATIVKGGVRITIFHPNTIQLGNGYAKIRKDNPFYLRIKAINTETNQVISGSVSRHLIYSCSHNANSTSYDDGEDYDVGITQRSEPAVHTDVSNRPRIEPTTSGQHSNYDGYFWDVDIDFNIPVMENVPYKVTFDIYNLNNEAPFEYAIAQWIPQWDWLWTDLFWSWQHYPENEYGVSIYTDIRYLEVTTTEGLRSNSDISLYRIFPKETSLCDVLLNYSKMFGLMWHIDDVKKTVTVMTRNRFFEDYHIEDWSDKIDRSKEFKFSPLSFDKRFVEFNVEEGECSRLKQYEAKYQNTYGTKKLYTGYEFNSDENKLFEKLQPSVISQKKQFSRMMNTEYEDRPNFVGYNYRVYPNEWYIDNDDSGSNAGMSGAFYFKNGAFAPDARLSLRDMNGTPIIMITDDTNAMIQKGEYCWNQCDENFTLGYMLPSISTISRPVNGKQYSVHFEAPKEYFFKPPEGTVKYIYNSYWKNYIDERYCSQNKKLTAYVYITPEEFAKIDFREFVKIDNILYHIDKIYDYNFNVNEPTKMDLVQVWNIDAYLSGQEEFKYIFAEPTIVDVTTSAQTVDIYSSGAWTITSQPSWVTTTISDNNITITPNGVPLQYRMGYINLNLTGTLYEGYVVVTQRPNLAAYVEVEQTTINFTRTGGTRDLLVSSSIMLRNGIQVTTNKSWLSAYIQDYTTNMAAPRNRMHLFITATRNTSISARNGRVDLTVTYEGTDYTTSVYVGQQSGYSHLVVDEERELPEIIDVFDHNGHRVLSLVSGTEYHFTDFFPEEIDVNSISITKGVVNVSGNSGEQTVTFTPQLSDGFTVGGGVITARTLNGKDVTYPYNVTSAAPAPTSRVVRVSAGEGGLFNIMIGQKVITTSYFDKKLNDGTVVKLTAIPNDDMAFSSWKNGVGNTYTTPSITFTVGSALVDVDGIISYYTDFVKSNNLVTLTVNGGGGYITIGDDSTHYNPLVRKVAAGTTISNIQAHSGSLAAFVKWSDGSTTNNRDYTVMTDTTLTPIFVNAGNQQLTIDGTGLYGANDYLTLSMNGTHTLKVGIGEVDTTKQPNATYALVATCNIKNLDSKFNWFKHTDSSNTNYYYDNPASYNYQMTNTKGNSIITVSTVPSMVYWTNDTNVDYVAELQQKQDLLLDPVFNSAKQDVETVIETDPYAEITIAITTDWKILDAIDDQGQDRFPDMTQTHTANNNWIVYYLSDTQDTNKILLHMSQA